MVNGSYIFDITAAITLIRFSHIVTDYDVFFVDTEKYAN